MKTKIKAKYLTGSTHYFEIITEITKNGITFDVDGTLVVYYEDNSGSNDYEFILIDEEQAIKLTKEEIKEIGEIAFNSQEL